MTKRNVTSMAILAIALNLLTSCAFEGWSGEGARERTNDDRFVLLDRPRTSPSGEFIARVEEGPVQNGVPTWIVLITDTAGEEVFRDDYPYSTRHGIDVTWLSSRDQLWILSSDVGEKYVEQAADGSWVKTGITPETLGSVPDEIKALMPALPE